MKLKLLTKVKNLCGLERVKMEKSWKLDNEIFLKSVLSIFSSIFNFVVRGRKVWNCEEVRWFYAAHSLNLQTHSLEVIKSESAAPALGKIWHHNSMNRKTTTILNSDVISVLRMNRNGAISRFQTSEMNSRSAL